ncbi:MAG: hypothetical protein NTY53_25395 [Kiritimatiellaeota bacterium]|nr:hypothetical protein [Kiritimatiellota bacterium]
MKLNRFIMVSWLAGLAALAQTASLPELKKQFETDVRTAQQQQREKLKAAGEQYLKVLDFAEQKIQEKGNEQALVWVRAERKRFEQAGDMPESALGHGPLRRAQEAWQEQTQKIRIEVAQRVAEVAGKYMQDLSQLQLQAAGNLTDLAEIKDETDRVLGNSVIREALTLAKTAAPAKPAADPEAPKNTKPATEPSKPAPVVAAKPLTGSVTVGDYKIFPLGKEPAAKELKTLRLEFPNVASRSAASAYGLGVAVFSDKEKLETNRQNMGWFAFKQEHGLVHTGARVTLACHGRDLPEGAKLVVQYFSHPANSVAESREERVEQIALPALPRGQTVVVDGAGIALGKFEHRGTYGRMKGGDEFYGLVVSLFDAGGTLLIQQCSSTALAKACTGKLPEEKPQEDLRARYGGGRGGKP